MATANKFSLIARNLCTSAGTKLIKPPIQVFGLEGRYATALYSAATKMKQLDAVEKDLLSLQESMKKNPKLREYITSPIINKKLLATALRESSEKANMQPSTGYLLHTLAENGRLKKLDNVINSFKIIMAAHRGDVVCEIVTAKPLDSTQTKQLEGALRSFLKGKESLKITARVDPSIIGGIIVSIGDKYVDMSISSKIKMYTDIINQAA